MYRADDLSGPLPTGQVESLALVDRNYQLSLTADMVTDVYSAVGTAAALSALATGTGGFIDLDSDGNLWAPSARVFYSPEPASPDTTYAGQHFYLPQGHVDPFGGTTTLSWEHDLAVVGTTDAVGNSTAAQVNYRVLQPWLVTDANQNRTGPASMRSARSQRRPSWAKKRPAAETRVTTSISRRMRPRRPTTPPVPTTTT